MKELETNIFKHGIYYKNDNLFVDYYLSRPGEDPKLLTDIIYYNFTPKSTNFQKFQFYLNYPDPVNDIRITEFDKFGRYGRATIYYPQLIQLKELDSEIEKYNESQIDLYLDTKEADECKKIECSEKMKLLRNKNIQETTITPMMKKRYYEVLRHLASYGVPINFEYFKDIFENKSKETYVTSYERNDFVGYYINFKEMFENIFYEVVDVEDVCS